MVKTGKAYTTVVCGKCEKTVHLNPSTFTRKDVVNLYNDGWGKSEHHGFVCADCVVAIFQAQNEHVWFAHNGQLI